MNCTNTEVLNFYQGETVEIPLQWQTADGEVMDLSKWQGQAILKPQLTTKTITYPITTTSPREEGNILVQISAMQTQEILPDSYQLLIKLSQGKKTHIIPDQGNIIIHINEI